MRNFLCFVAFLVALTSSVGLTGAGEVSGAATATSTIVESADVSTTTAPVVIRLSTTQPELSLVAKSHSGVNVTTNDAESATKLQVSGNASVSSVTSDKAKSPLPVVHPTATTGPPSSHLSANATASASANLYSTIVSDDHTGDNETTHKFCLYLKPICNSIDNIQPKQFFKIQSQFKKFVEQTNGKLSTCFLETYKFDPALKPITKVDLSSICSSIGANGTYKSFQECAAINWAPTIDKDLDTIIEARSKTKNGKTTHDRLTGEEEEVSLIKDFVSKIFGGGDEDDKNTNLSASNKSASLSTTKKPYQQVPLAPGKTFNSTASNHSSITKELINDPNTVVVFMDESSGNSNGTLEQDDKNVTSKIETTMPTKDSSLSIDQTTVKPKIVVHTSNTTVTTMPNGTTVAPINAENKVNASAHTSLVAPTNNGSRLSSGVKPSNLTTKSLEASASVSVKTTTGTTVGPTIEKVDVSDKTTTKAPEPVKLMITKKSTTAPVAYLKPSEKPLETLEQLLRRQEKEKQELDAKFRAERERTLKLLQKKQDEIDAQNAIRALQFQREAFASAHNSDNRLHQLEHERQMSIDPLGHTIKHQQYELNKQRKAISTSGK